GDFVSVSIPPVNVVLTSNPLGKAFVAAICVGALVGDKQLITVVFKECSKRHVCSLRSVAQAENGGRRWLSGLVHSIDQTQLFVRPIVMGHAFQKVPALCLTVSASGFVPTLIRFVMLVTPCQLGPFVADGLVPDLLDFQRCSTVGALGLPAVGAGRFEFPLKSCHRFPFTSFLTTMHILYIII